MSLDDKLLTGRPHGGLSIMWNKLCHIRLKLYNLMTLVSLVLNCSLMILLYYL